MLTISTLGDNTMRQYSGKVRRKLTKGRPDMWGLGLLKSNGKRKFKNGRSTK